MSPEVVSKFKVGSFNGEKLFGSNFDSWRIEMKLHLMQYCAWSYIEKVDSIHEELECQSVSGVLKSHGARVNMVLLGVILNSIHSNQVYLFIDIDCAARLWFNIKERYGKQTVANVRVLRHKLQGLRLLDHGNFDLHAKLFEQCVSELAKCGKVYEEDDLVSFFLDSLPSSMDQLITLYNHSALRPEGIDKTLTLSWVIYEARVVWNRQKGSKSIALNSRFSKGLKAGGSFTKKNGFGAKGKGFSNGKLVCWDYGVEGHKRGAKECNGVTDGHQGKSQALMMGKNFSSVVGVGSSTTNEDISLYSTWYIDSGASFHMSSIHCSHMSEYVPVDDMTVTTADGNVLEVKGKGNISVMLIVGNERRVTSIKNVYYVPGIGFNLLSIAEFENKGLTVSFKQGKIVIESNGRLIATGRRVENTYLLNVEKSKTALLVKQKEVTEAQMELLHRRLGHAYEGAIRNIISKDLIEGLDSRQELVRCSGCQSGKAHRKMFKKESGRIYSAVGDVVYSDLMGPMDCESLGKARYVLTFKDAFSGFSFVRFLKRKDEAAQEVKDFVKLLKIQFGKNLKVLHTDGGGEFRNDELKLFCASEGIVQEFGFAGTPQHNGVAERLNRTLMDTVRSMMYGTMLPKSCWAELVSTACFLRNLIPKEGMNVTPYEVMYGGKFNGKHLKVIGCLVYVGILKSQLKKTDPRCIKGYLVGYVSNGYRVYLPTKGKVVESRDVDFDETLFSFDNSHELNTKDFAKVVELHSDVENDSADDSDVDESLVSKHCVSSEKIDELGIDDVAGVHDIIDTGGAVESINDVDSIIGYSADSEKEDVGQGVINEYESSDDELVLRVNSKQMAVVVPMMKQKCENELDRVGCISGHLVLQVSVGDESEMEPTSYEQAIGCPASKKWKEAMQEEYESLMENGTWSLMKLPQGRKSIGSKWVFKLKRDEHGVVNRHKARLVALGYRQVEGIDYSETYAPVLSMRSLRFIIALSVEMNMQLYQCDVVTAFLNGYLKEDIYMNQPVGYEVKGKEELVCKLERRLYGLKQSPREWNAVLNAFMQEVGFKRVAPDEAMYIKFYKNGSLLLIGIYVDDLIIASKDSSAVEEFKATLGKKFKMKDLGNIR